MRLRQLRLAALRRPRVGFRLSSTYVSASTLLVAGESIRYWVGALVLHTSGCFSRVLIGLDCSRWIFLVCVGMPRRLAPALSLLPPICSLAVGALQIAGCKQFARIPARWASPLPCLARLRLLSPLHIGFGWTRQTPALLGSQAVRLWHFHLDPIRFSFVPSALESALYGRARAASATWKACLPLLIFRMQRHASPFR